MFFDTMAGIVERHLPEFAGRMKAAAMFRLEKDRREKTVEESVSAWEPDQQTIENFRLPFPSLFLEYADSRNSPSDRGILLFVEDMPSRRLGFLSGWVSTDKTLLGAGSLIALPDVEDGLMPNGRNQRTAVMKTAMRLWEGDKKLLVSRPPQLDAETEVPHHVHAELSGRGAIADREGLARLLRECKLSIDSFAAKHAYLSCVSAILSVLIINEPGSFIVEERPLLPTGDPKHLMIPRAGGRPHYIVLKPRQIRQRFIYPDKGVDPEAEETDTEHRRKVGAHERRGHYRRLSAERFKNARGQVIWIDPIWVGPSEAVRGPNRYKVRLDL